MRQKILVTGGVGFIGSNFVRMFQHKYDITVLDLLTYAGRKANLEGVDCKFIQGDIRDKELVNKIMKKADAVVSFAAETHVDRSIKMTDDFITTNINGTHVLLEAAIKNKIKKFVHISTDEVYGPAVGKCFKEDAPMIPSSPYSASKAAGDLLCQVYHKTFGLPVVIVRPSNNYGQFQMAEKFIPRFILLAMHNRPLPLFYPGMQMREWLHVYDCCRGINTVLEKGKVGEAYNLGSGDIRKNIDVAKIILKMMPESKSKIKMVKDRPAHDWRYSIDSEKIRKLGWKPELKFEAGLLSTILWMQDTPEFWQKSMKDKFVNFK